MNFGKLFLLRVIICCYIVISSVFCCNDTQQRQLSVFRKRDTGISLSFESLSRYGGKLASVRDSIIGSWVAVPEGKKLLVSGFATASIGTIAKIAKGIIDHDDKAQKQAWIQFALGVAGLVVMLVAEGPWGMVIGGLLSGLAVMLFPPKQLTPNDIFLKLWGRINGLVYQGINNRLTATRINNIQSLLVDLKDLLYSYAQLMHIDSTLSSRGRSMVANDSFVAKSGIVSNGTQSRVIPYLPNQVLPHGAEDVRLYMSQIETLIRSNHDWYSNPGISSPNKPDSFMLLSAQGLSSPVSCLHTQDDNVSEGTYLIVDDKCDLDNQVGKTFTYEAASGRLILRVPNGKDMCVAYGSKHGSRIDYPLAVYSLNSPPCLYSSFPVHVNLVENGLALFTGRDQLCVSNSLKPGEANIIVNPKAKVCKYNLVFKLQLPVPTVGQTLPGVTSESATAYISYREIGVQLFYFPSIAGIHLLSLKERYLYGDEKELIPVTFSRTIERYKVWLDVFIPIFSKYCSFQNMDGSVQIQAAIEFRKTLDDADIAADQAIWKVPL